MFAIKSPIKKQMEFVGVLDFLIYPRATMTAR